MLIQCAIAVVRSREMTNTEIPFDTVCWTFYKDVSASSKAKETS